MREPYDETIGASIAALARGLIKLLEAQDPRPRGDQPRAALGAFARLLQPLTEASQLPAEHTEPTALPVCRHFAASLAQANGVASSLALHLTRIAPALCWVQNPNYRRAPPSPSFLASYGYAVIAGPASGAPAPARVEDLAFGVLLLAPETVYPEHRHPASEIYVPLSPAEWLAGETGFVERAPGGVIHHPPNLIHATRSGASPLAALYLWAGDLETYARLVG
jgi:hypothetical protein